MPLGQRQRVYDSSPLPGDLPQPTPDAGQIQTRDNSTDMSLLAPVTHQYQDSRNSCGNDTSGTKGERNTAGGVRTDTQLQESTSRREAE